MKANSGRHNARASTIISFIPLCSSGFHVKRSSLHSCKKDTSRLDKRWMMFNNILCIRMSEIMRWTYNTKTPQAFYLESHLESIGLNPTLLMCLFAMHKSLNLCKIVHIICSLNLPTLIILLWWIFDFGYPGKLQNLYLKYNVIVTTCIWGFFSNVLIENESNFGNDIMSSEVQMHYKLW